MPEIGVSTNDLTSNVPKKSLAKIFNGSFNRFFNEALKSLLKGVNISVLKDNEGKDVMVGIENDKIWGARAIFVAQNFYAYYEYREFLGEEKDFTNSFASILAFIIFEVRKKEYLWGKIYREIDKLIVVKDTETHTASGKTGKNDQSERETQRTFSKELNQKENKSGNVQGWEQEGTIVVRKGINIVPLGKIISAHSVLEIDFSVYYQRFSHLFDSHCTPMDLQPIYDPTIGRRRWVSREEYEEIIEKKEGDKKKPKLGVDPWKVLEEYEKTKNREKYLEALKIYHANNEKDWAKMPDSSNRKPRIENRIKVGSGLIPAYETFRTLPTLSEFRRRARGEVAGYNKIIGYEVIIKQIEKWLIGWEHYYEFKDKYPDVKPPRQLMLALLGSPGLGKSYIAKEIAKLLGVGYSAISLNGKNSSSIIYGTSMDNPGGEIGEVAKAISRNKDQISLILFDEIEKAGLEAKQAIGNPTDRTQNYMFKDDFLDFPVPCNNVIFFCALNYPEQLPDFIADRFEKVIVQPYSYHQRIEMARSLLQIGLNESLMNALIRERLGRTPQEIYNLLNQESLLKKTLTWTFSVRGMKENIEDKLLGTLSTEFLSKYDRKPFPSDVINYDWGFFARENKEELDLGDKNRGRAPCPYAKDKTQLHRKISDPVPPGYIPSKCECFVNNLNRVPGWKENIGG